MKISDCFFSVRTFLCLWKIKLIMRLSTFFLLIALQVTAKNHAQEAINLKATNASIRDIFRKIEDQTRYRFFYSSDDLPAGQRFSIEVENAGINQTLSTLFDGTHYTWKLIPGHRVVISLSNQTSERQTPKRGFSQPGFVIHIPKRLGSRPQLLTITFGSL